MRRPLPSRAPSPAATEKLPVPSAGISTVVGARETVTGVGVRAVELGTVTAGLSPSATRVRAGVGAGALVSVEPSHPSTTSAMETPTSLSRWSPCIPSGWARRAGSSARGAAGRGENGRHRCLQHVGCVRGRQSAIVDLVGGSVEQTERRRDQPFTGEVGSEHPLALTTGDQPSETVGDVGLTTGDDPPL